MGSHRASRLRRGETAAPLARLARFVGTTLTDPVVFGGGAYQARVGLRVQTVAHGYLGVVEGYVAPDSGTVWSTLTVALPCTVPAMTIDHRSAHGLPGVPFAGGHAVQAGQSNFDEHYQVAAPDPGAVANLLTSGLCGVLLQEPVQRLSFEGSRLLVRTFDGFDATPEVVTWLNDLAGSVLAATPAFVTRLTAAAGPTVSPQTFPPGLYGPDDPDDIPSDGTRGAGLSGRFRFAVRKRAY
jgi:hypothetical protein